MIKIIVVGKLKEQYLKDMVMDYEKRLSKYHKIKIIEVKDSNIIDEAKEIKKYIKSDDYVICLQIDGKELSTLELKDYIENKFNNGISDLTFIIGGSDGIDDSIKKNSDDKISFSRLTFPHGLFRTILLEQLYRCFKIMNNESYHK